MYEFGFLRSWILFLNTPLQYAYWKVSLPVKNILVITYNLHHIQSICKILVELEVELGGMFSWKIGGVLCENLKKSPPGKYCYTNSRCSFPCILSLLKNSKFFEKIYHNSWAPWITWPVHFTFKRLLLNKVDPRRKEHLFCNNSFIGC